MKTNKAKASSKKLIVKKQSIRFLGNSLAGAAGGECFTRVSGTSCGCTATGTECTNSPEISY